MVHFYTAAAALTCFFGGKSFIPACLTSQLCNKIAGILDYAVLPILAKGVYC